MSLNWLTQSVHSLLFSGEILSVEGVSLEKLIF